MVRLEGNVKYTLQKISLMIKCTHYILELIGTFFGLWQKFPTLFIVDINKIRENYELVKRPLRQQ